MMVGSHGACQLSWDWDTPLSLQASVREACRREARVPRSERVGDTSGASIADLGPGSMLLGDEDNEFSETPFARVRSDTSYVHKEGVTVTICRQRDSGVP